LSRKPGAVPPPLDVERIVDALHRHAVEYILIGGLAAAMHGSPVATWSLDLTPAADDENVARLTDALRDLDISLDDQSLASDEILTMTTSAGWLGVCWRPAGGQSYETLIPTAETYDLFGLSVRVASLDDLIRSNLALARHRDLATVPMLRELRRRRN